MFIVLLVIVLAGCKDDTRTRVSYSKEQITRNLRKPAQESQTWAQIRDAELKELDQSTPQSLKAPKLAAAVEWQAGHGPGICVWWVEGRPSVDAVRLRLQGSTDSVAVPMGNDNIEIARGTQKDTVVFGAIVALPTPFSAQYGVPQGKLEVALQREGAVVTPYVPMLHWTDAAGNPFTTRPTTQPE
jgi:hypothetical protein